MHSRYASGVIAVGEGEAVFSSRLWKPGTASVPAIYCHHATGTARSAILPTSETDFSIRRIIEAVTLAGHPVIATDQGGASNWGADPAPARMDGALARIGEFGARTDRVLLLADSMGAVVALNWARANPELVAAVALLVPVVNMEHAHDNASAPLPANIEAAYGGNAAYLAALATRNPFEHQEAYAEMPIRLWYSDDDPTAAASQVLEFAEGSDSDAVSMGAVGHAVPAAFDVAPVAEFLTGHA